MFDPIRFGRAELKTFVIFLVLQDKKQKRRKVLFDTYLGGEVFTDGFHLYVWTGTAIRLGRGRVGPENCPPASSSRDHRDFSDQIIYGPRRAECSRIVRHTPSGARESELQTSRY